MHGIQYASYILFLVLAALTSEQHVSVCLSYRCVWPVSEVEQLNTVLHCLLKSCEIQNLAYT